MRDSMNLPIGYRARRVAAFSRSSKARTKSARPANCAETRAFSAAPSSVVRASSSNEEATPMANAQPVARVSFIPRWTASPGAVFQTILAALALFLFAAQPAMAVPHNPANEVCAACHEDISKSFENNVHKQKSCEACHGPSAKHQESASAGDIRQPAKLRASEVDKTCLACHLNKPAHSGRIQSVMAKIR